MLDMGFLEDVDFIGSHMPEGLQMLVFSATIPEKLKPFLKSIWPIRGMRMLSRSTSRPKNRTRADTFQTQG